VQRTGPWLISAGLHGVLLLGAALFALERYVSGADGRSGAGFDCDVRTSTVMFDHIEQPLEVFHRKVPSPDSWADSDAGNGFLGFDPGIGLGGHEHDGFC